MSTPRFRPRRSAALVVAALLVPCAGVGVAAAAPQQSVPTTSPPATTVPVPTTAPPTTAPPTTGPPTVPSTTVVGPATTSPGTSLVPTMPGSTTTVPGASTTTITTLPGDAPLTQQQPDGSWIQPVIPDIESDPVFHAARRADEASVDVDKAREVSAKAMLDEVVTRRRARSTGDALALATANKREADRVVARAERELHNAVMRTYMGFGADSGGVQTVVVNGPDDPHAVSRTYLNVTAGEARARLAEGKATQAQMGERLAVAQRDARGASSAHRSATRALGGAHTALAEAQRTLRDARKALVDALAAAPDFGPGKLELLPENLPEGSTTVASPAGLIVLPPGTDPRTAYALSFVVSQIGKPYVWGAVGPSTYDCSGLMLRAWASVGVGIPRVSQAQQASITPVAAKDVRPGDLVFFGTPAYHVGMYIGGGLMINAPFTGSYVRIDRVWSTVSSFGRVLPATTPTP